MTISTFQNNGLTAINEFFETLNDKQKTLAIAEDSPLFFIKLIRKNTEYLTTLKTLLQENFNVVSRLYDTLKTQEWSQNLVDSINDNDGFHPIDVSYAAFLCGAIGQSMFYDFISFYHLNKSFSGKEEVYQHKNNPKVIVPALPQAISLRQITNKPFDLSQPQFQSLEHFMAYRGDDRTMIYLQYVIYSFTSHNYYPFSFDRFMAKFRSIDGPLSFFEVKIDARQMKEAIKNKHHRVWFSILFRNGSYPLIQEFENGEDAVYLFPGHDLLTVFIASVSQDATEEIKPVMALGAASSDTLLGMHQAGYHLVSVLDERMSSIATLHKRLGNAMEVQAHDYIYHALILSAHPVEIREVFFGPLYQALNDFKQDVSFNDRKGDPVILKTFINEMISRIIDLPISFSREQIYQSAFKQQYLYITMHNLFLSVLGYIFLAKHPKMEINLDFLVHTKSLLQSDDATVVHQIIHHYATFIKKYDQELYWITCDAVDDLFQEGLNFLP